MLLREPALAAAAVTAAVTCSARMGSGRRANCASVHPNAVGSTVAATEMKKSRPRSIRRMRISSSTPPTAVGEGAADVPPPPLEVEVALAESEDAVAVDATAAALPAGVAPAATSLPKLISRATASSTSTVIAIVTDAPGGSMPYGGSTANHVLHSDRSSGLGTNLWRATEQGGRTQMSG